jgi:3',5'-cyclic AMP phosphodiesterase CpdA/SAM-dependent methyltransferase
MSTIRIAFISDVHLGEDPKHSRTQFAEFKQLCDELLENHRIKRFDFLFIGGDLVDMSKARRSSRNEGGFYVSADLDQNLKFLQESVSVVSDLVRDMELAPERLVVIPGNHEQSRFHLEADDRDQSLEEAFLNAFCALNASTFRDGATVEFVSFVVRRTNVLLALIRSDDLRNRDSDGMRGISGQVSSEVLDRLRDLPPIQPGEVRIGMVHHNPLHLPVALDTSTVTGSIVTGAQLLQELQNSGFGALLHGHLHVPAAILYSGLEKLGDDTSYRFRRPMFVVSAGSAGSAARARDSKVSWMAVEVDPFVSLVEPPVRVEIHDSPKPTKLVVPGFYRRFQEQRYDDECFLTQDLGASDSTTQEHFWTLFDKSFEPTVDSVYNNPWFIIKDRSIKEIRDCKDRNLELDRLLKRVRAHNRKNLSLPFTVLPKQLDRVYDVGNIIFSIDEGLFAAEEEFGGRSKFGKQQDAFFSEFVMALRWQTRKRGGSTRSFSHLDWANRIIASYINKTFGNGSTDQRSELRVFEAGFGGLCTLLQIAQEWLGESADRVIKYLGVDVSQEMVDFAHQFYRDTPDFAFKLTRVQPLENRPKEADNIFMKMDVWSALCDGSLKGDLPSNLDVVVMSYSFHHVFSPKRFMRSVLRGDLMHYLFAQSLGSSYSLKILETAISEIGLFSSMIHDVTRAKVTDLLAIIESCMEPATNTPQHEWRKIVDQNIKRHSQKLEEIVSNRQMQLLKRMYECLRVNGRIIIADPNGFSSSFNRPLVLEDSLLPLSYFNDHTELCFMLESAGFEIEQVIRQVRLQDSRVVNIPMDLDAIRECRDWDSKVADILFHDLQARGARNSSLEDFRGEASDQSDVPIKLDYQDLHLGYIVIARKLELSQLFKPLFSAATWERRTQELIWL